MDGSTEVEEEGSMSAGNMSRCRNSRAEVVVVLVVSKEQQRQETMRTNNRVT